MNSWPSLFISKRCHETKSIIGWLTAKALIQYVLYHLSSLALPTHRAIEMIMDLHLYSFHSVQLANSDQNESYTFRECHVCSRSSPPRRLRAPGCPASRTPTIHYTHLPSLITRISNIGLTWTHSTPVITSPIFVSSPALFPTSALIVFRLCFLVCWRCSCLVPH